MTAIRLTHLTHFTPGVALHTACVSGSHFCPLDLQVRIDQLKAATDAAAIASSCAGGNCWVMVRKSRQEVRGTR